MKSEGKHCISNGRKKNIFFIVYPKQIPFCLYEEMKYCNENKEVLEALEELVKL